MTERVRIREIAGDEGRWLLRIIRRGADSVVTWRRAQMVPLSAQGMPVARIAEGAFTSDDRVCDVIHDFTTDGFDSLYPKCRGGRPKTFTLGNPAPAMIACRGQSRLQSAFIVWPGSHPGADAPRGPAVS